MLAEESPDQTTVAPASGTGSAGPGVRAGPARWVVLGMLAGGSITGLVWSLHSRPVPVVTHAPMHDRGAGMGGMTHEPALRTELVSSAGEKAALEVESSREPVSNRQLVNLNTASLAELDTLPGIGLVTARAIIDYRTRHGAFRVLSELDKIKGIGPATIEKLRPLVTVDSPKPTGQP